MLKALLTIPFFLSGFIAVAEANGESALAPTQIKIIIEFENKHTKDRPTENGSFEHFESEYTKGSPSDSVFIPATPKNLVFPPKQAEQSHEELKCEETWRCKEICDDIFQRSSGRSLCYGHSIEMVHQFEDLIEAVEDGDVREIGYIGSDVLKHILDLDTGERAIARAIKKMSRREAQDFAVLIVEDGSFTEALEKKDSMFNEFNILRQLINRLTRGGGLEEALSQKIKGEQKTLLWLFSEYNERAWEWLDSYVDEECDGRDSADCPGGESIGAYCKALLGSNFRRRDWEDFLSGTSLFADVYEVEVEDEGYEYEITDSPGRDYQGDFRDYCKLKAKAAHNTEEKKQKPLGTIDN